MTGNLNDFAGSYGADFKFHFDNEIMLNWYPRRIMKLTDRKSRVLELGIGHGYTCNHFSEFYEKYIVIDGSKPIIDDFKHRHPNSKAITIHTYFENFKANPEFDVIIMGFVLEHVNDPIQILKQFRQFLAPNGKCFVAVPNAESLHRRFGHAAGLLPNMLTLGKGDESLGHQRLYTVRSLMDQLQACGYSVIRKEGIFLKPLTTDQLRSLSLGENVLLGMCKVGVEYPELSAGLLFEAEIAT